VSFIRYDLTMAKKASGAKVEKKKRTPKAEPTTLVVNPWKRLNTNLRYDNAWISVTEDKILKPNGEPGLYGVVHFKNIAVGVLALHKNAKNEESVILVGQYRYPLGRYSWEIPEGGCPAAEQPLAAAKRELKEETGFVAKSWKKVLEMDLSNSSTDERAMIYLATDLKAGPSQPEETEVLQQKSVSLTKAVEMVLRGEITDGISVAAILYAQVALGRA
jgi:8-oxo-dGTP pyrophosphatase MutT (NUDIX family)